MRVTAVTTLCLAFASSGAVRAVPLLHDAEAFASRRDVSPAAAPPSAADGAGAFSLSGLFDLIPDIVPLFGDIFGSGATPSGNNTRRDVIIHSRNAGNVDNASVASAPTDVSSSTGKAPAPAGDSSDGSTENSIFDDILGLLPDVLPLLLGRDADSRKRDFLEDLVNALAGLLSSDLTSQKRDIVQLWTRKGAPKISSPKKPPVSPPQKPPTTPQPPPPPLTTPKVAPSAITKPTTAAPDPPVTPSAPPVTVPSRPSTTLASEAVTEASQNEITTPSASPNSPVAITTSQAPSAVTSAPVSAVTTTADPASGDGSSREGDDDDSTSDDGVSLPDAVSAVTGLVGVFTGLFPPATATVDVSSADATSVVNNGNNITVSPDITVNLTGAASSVVAALATSTVVLQPSASANATTSVSSSGATSTLATDDATAAPTDTARSAPVGLTDIL